MGRGDHPPPCAASRLTTVTAGVTRAPRFHLVSSQKPQQAAGGPCLAAGETEAVGSPRLRAAMGFSPRCLLGL